MKVKGHTPDLVVVDLEAAEDEWVQLNQGVAYPNIVRVYKDHIEVDAEIESASTGQKRKKTLKFWLDDLLLMNETLFRIQHPTK